MSATRRADRRRMLGIVVGSMMFLAGVVASLYIYTDEQRCLQAAGDQSDALASCWNTTAQIWFTGAVILVTLGILLVGGAYWQLSNG